MKRSVAGLAVGEPTHRAKSVRDASGTHGIGGSLAWWVRAAEVPRSCRNVRGMNGPPLTLEVGYEWTAHPPTVTRVDSLAKFAILHKGMKS